MEQGDRGFGENTLRWGETVGESETPVLVELNEGLGVAFMVKLEKRKVRNE
jgi:hypothetical protein